MDDCRVSHHAVAYTTTNAQMRLAKHNAVEQPY